MVISTEQFSILLIDDDEVDRITVKRALKKAQFPGSLIEAVNGREAIEQLKLGHSSNNSDNQNISSTSPAPVDLILLDYFLPDIDGLHLLGKIKGLGINLPIIVLTGDREMNKLP